MRINTYRFFADLENEEQEPRGGPKIRLNEYEWMGFAQGYAEMTQSSVRVFTEDGVKLATFHPR